MFARIRVALRHASAPATDETVAIETGDFFVDQAARTVKVRNQIVHLTPKEYELLLYFLRNPNRVLTHRVLLGAVWGGESVEQQEYLRVFIGQLRKKIEIDTANPQYILTDPWVGYRFQPQGTTGEKVV
jgi:two-component system KDP operon response regulator KdpE